MTSPTEIVDVLRGGSEWEDRRWFPPGPQLALCLAGEHHDRLAGRSDAELIEVMAAARRQTSWAQARELAAIAELTARREPPDPHDTPQEQGPGEDARTLSDGESLIEEISAALTITGNAAATLMHLARQLNRALPATRTALETGSIDLPRARIICEATQHLPSHTAALLEAAVLPRAATQTTGQLRRRTSKLARRLDPDAYHQGTQQTRHNRRVEVWDTTNGTAALALLDIATEDAHAIHNKLTAAARTIRSHHHATDQGSARTLDQIRADLAQHLLRGHTLPQAITALLADGPVPTNSGSPKETASTDSTSQEARETPRPPTNPPSLTEDITGPGETGIPSASVKYGEPPGGRNPATDNPRDDGARTISATALATTRLAHPDVPLPSAPTKHQEPPSGRDPTSGSPHNDNTRMTPIEAGDVTRPGHPSVPVAYASVQGQEPPGGCEPGSDVAQVDGARVIAGVAECVQQRLTRARVRLRRSGRLHELPQVAATILREVHRTLAPLREAWCPTGRDDQHGHHGYRPPDTLRRIILARHPTCTFPTCNRAAEHCDVDHTIAYQAGGPTCGCNLAVLCRRHHRCKQRNDWQLFQPWPGLLIWITPSGTWHIVKPE